MNNLINNYDRMYNMEKIPVIHTAFEDSPRAVAMVWVGTKLSTTEKLDKAFMLTNSIDDAWWNNKDVEAIFPDKGCRSTSVGDHMLLDGKKWVCEASGWKELAIE
jgi:hypothetical protein